MPDQTPNLAKNYLLRDRRLTKESIIEWQLGICPDWNIFAKHFSEEIPSLMGKYAQFEKLADACGLIKTKNDRRYDFLHHRITIPIHDAEGRVVGIAGRSFGQAEGPKYINPPESPVYPKSKILFGLHKARKHFSRHGGAVLVEGYFDVIKLHQAGWDNAIATCGTALTEDQAKLLKRYTDTVFIMRDGDKAGRKAIEKDITVLIPHAFKVYVIELPAGEDPDSLFDDAIKTREVCSNYVDGLEWIADKWLSFAIRTADSATLADGIESLAQLLADVHETRREVAIKTICKKYKLKERDFTKPVTRILQQRDQEKKDAERAALEQDPSEKLPSWVNRNELEENGFVQLVQSTKHYKAGIYFVGEYGPFSVTNYTIKPLYHIYDQSNNRRLIEVNNCVKSAVIEMPTTGFTQQSTFETELMNKGHFVKLVTFQPRHFIMIRNWLSAHMPICYELKTLGWQPEGFFAFSNSVFVPSTGEMHEYNELGVVEIEGKHYISLANSRIHHEERLTENPYENDKYLSYTKASITLPQWINKYCRVYGDNGRYGVAFVFLTAFKDIVTRYAKMPMLYCYGPKGSGKSALAESTTRLFFAGKDSEGNLIQGFNLNPGQSTPFSFFNRVERFRNCPILFNEFDENEIEPWKFGTFKAAYDGEGREVGDGSTFKNRKTKVQKVQGTLIIVGQYLSIKDDGSVLSRSISCQFGIEKMRSMTDDDRSAFEELRNLEESGLSSLIIDLLRHRPMVQKEFSKIFSDTQNQLTKDTRSHRIEARLISNYSLVLTAVRTMEKIGISLPFKYEEFYAQVRDQVINHNRMLKDNSAIHQFWKSVEVLFDQGKISKDIHVKVRSVTSLTVKKGESTEKKEFTTTKRVLIVRFSNLYSEYAKFQRERSGKSALPEDTLLLYMKEQPYFIGLVPVEYWNDKRTSGYAFDYDMMESMGVVLQKDEGPAEAPPVPPTPPAAAQGDLDLPDWVKE